MRKLVYLTREEFDKILQGIEVERADAEHFKDEWIEYEKEFAEAMNGKADIYLGASGEVQILETAVESYVDALPSPNEGLIDIDQMRSRRETLQEATEFKYKVRDEIKKGDMLTLDRGGA